MLHDIRIRNLGVIEEATAEFAEGLTVVTGETGAGKTMVVSSLRLLSGHRANASKVRVGADKAIIEGIFSAPTDAPSAAENIEAIISDFGGFADDGEYIASRTVTASGRSRAHLAGKTVAAGILSQFANHVLTIHGQNDQLRLQDSTRQLEALDQFAGLEDKVSEFASLRRAWLASKKDLEQRTAARRELALETDTLQRAIATIDEIDPQPHEDEELKERITRLQDADDLRSAMQHAMTAIDGAVDASGEGDLTAGANDLLGQAQSALNVKDEQLHNIGQRIGELISQLSDISMEIGNALVDVPDPDELQDMLQRQQQLRELRRFAVDVDGALAWRDEARERLASIDVSGEALEELKEKVDEQHDHMMRVGKELSTARQSAAKKFATAVTKEIKGLHMSAKVDVALTQGQPNARGLDECEFQMVQGGHRTALASSASGGELSRVMLALEVILAGHGRTMVFDEVDAGVGGKAAVEIGRRLATLAKHNQVIVVTHLPQVAAFADAHVYVDKSATETTVSSSVRSLSPAERVAELSRMLAGLESDSGRAHAEELLAMAEEAKAEN